MLKKNITANLLGQIWSAVMKFAFIPLYIDILGIQSYGLIGIFTLLQAWFIVLDFGLSPSISRQMSLFNSGGISNTSIRDLLRSIEIVALMIAILIAIGVFLGADWLAKTLVKSSEFSSDEVKNAFIIMGIISALRFYEGIYHNVIIGLEKQVLFNFINGLIHTLRSVGALVVITWLDSTIIAFFIWQGVCSFLQTIILMLVIYKILPVGNRGARFSIKSLQTIRMFAGGVLVITILSLIVAQVDKLVIASYINLGEYGYYTLAATIASALTMISAPIIQAVYPRLIGLVAISDKDGLRSVYHLTSQLITIATSSITFIIAIFSSDIVYLWTNNYNTSQETAPILTIMIIGSFFSVLNQLPQSFQVAHNYLFIPLITNSLSLVILILMIILALPNYGVLGVAGAVAVTMALALFMSTWQISRKMIKNKKINIYLYDTILPMIGALIPVVLAFKFYSNYNLSRIEQVIFFSLLLFTSFLCSVIMATEFRPILFQQVKKLMNYK
ncbi:MAG: oligosaccharide flippase family protein [Polynucleobacter sp.]|uniref:oligosaccharide flippase family protein n=1 Tax=Polynucleobacter sp. TaxID=2029855 RepID=UPI00271F2959|nr:oligosaccharide flippase family protein [Polynucleobacter sp.]MDO8714690.1 oligosaccharide flippase family protein [Polynucleobacter sp.]